MTVLSKSTIDSSTEVIGMGVSMGYILYMRTA